MNNVIGAPAEISIAEGVLEFLGVAFCLADGDVQVIWGRGSVSPAVVDAPKLGKSIVSIRPSSKNAANAPVGALLLVFLVGVRP